MFCLLNTKNINKIIFSSFRYHSIVRLDELFPPLSTSNSKLSFDSTKAAATYIKFLDLINPELYSDIYIDRAINRYIKYFELAEDVYLKEKAEGIQNLVPTRDISFIWATHMIHPHNYRKWRKQHFDGSEEGKIALNTWFSNQCIRVIQENINYPFINQWKERYDNTEKKWKEKYNEEYLLANNKLPKQQQLLPDSSINKLLDIDLHSATQRHLRFRNRVIKFKPIINREYLTNASERYEKFLNLANDKVGTLVPTLDIDIIWHSHMLSPVNYFDECHKLAGRVLDHKDELPSSDLQSSFDSTKSLWNKKYKSNMVTTSSKAKPIDKSTSKSHIAACGSCGFGDTAFHSGLLHGIHESTYLDQVGDVETTLDDEFFGDESNWVNTYDKGSYVEETFDNTTSTSSWGFSWDFFSGWGNKDEDSNDGNNNDGGDTGSNCSSCSSCGGD